MKKFIMILAVCVLLVGILATNGTFAFLNNISNIFSDLTSILGIDNGTPENDEGQFKVELALQTRDGSGGLITTNEIPVLLPAVYSDDYAWPTVATKVGDRTYSLWQNGSGVNGIVDKFVSVTNMSEKTEDSDHDAYFRIAFAVQEEAFQLLHLNFNENRDDYEWTAWTKIQIGGRDYRMIIATYQKALAAGETSPAALLQVALDKKTTNEDAEKITSDFLQIQVMAVDATLFNAVPTTDGGTKTYTAQEALDAALPLANLNPF